jgi:hypothetical protein
MIASSPCSGITPTSSRPKIEAEIEANSLESVLVQTGAIQGDDGVIRFPKKP